MISFEILDDANIIILRTAGRPRFEDYQDVAPKFFADVNSQNIRRILLDWRQFDGWGTKEAPSMTFFSWIESLPLFDRIAVVFHDGVRNEVDKFEEVFRNADKDIRRFRPDRYEAALDWLKAENGEDRPA
jgi:hypothetical protein